MEQNKSYVGQNKLYVADTATLLFSTRRTCRTPLPSKQDRRLHGELLSNEGVKTGREYRIAPVCSRGARHSAEDDSPGVAIADTAATGATHHWHRCPNQADASLVMREKR